jgi:hypothetical protein
MGDTNGGDYYPWYGTAYCSTTSHHPREFPQRGSQQRASILTVSRIVPSPNEVANSRYEELLGETFERIYFERPTKFHKVGATDMMSVYRRRV